MDSFTLEALVDRAGVDVSLDLIGMFLEPNDLLRLVVVSVRFSRRLARRPWNIVDRAGNTSGTVTFL